MTDLWCGGRRVVDAADAVRRYCGLPWSGGEDETWSWRYFDEVADAAPSVVLPVDVLAAGSLHSGLGKADLEFFVNSATTLNEWLSQIPVGADLSSVDVGVVEAVIALPQLADPMPLSLVTKVLHRKRPGLVPMLDRALQEQYRSPGRARGAAMWPALVTSIREDLRDHRNAAACRTIGDVVEISTGVRPTSLRILDIAIWMTSRH